MGKCSKRKGKRKMAGKEQKRKKSQYRKNDVIAKVRAYIQKYKMFERGETVITGISGGADSVCLFFILRELQEELGIRLAAVHVNHGIRGEDALEDQKFVEKLCREEGVPLEIVSCQLELIARNRKQSMEEAGRNIRREAFAEAAQKYGASKIALAHHKNDNAETLFMNLVRGAGLNGLAGIKPVIGSYVRPLLCLERREIEGFLEENGISYQTDQTNLTDAYTRNKIRNRVIPYLETQINPRAAAHMSEAAEQLQKVQEFLAKKAETFREGCVSRQPGGILIQEKPFQRGEQILREMAVLSCLEEAAGQAKDLSAVHVADVLALFEKQCGRQISLPYHMRAVRGYEGVLIEKRKEDAGFRRDGGAKTDDGMKRDDETREIFHGETESGETLCQIPGTVYYRTPQGKEAAVTCRLVDLLENPGNLQKSHTNCFDYAIIKNDLCVRTRRPGDYIVIDRAGRKQKLKSYLINEKIPAKERDEILLIADGSHILWIVGHRLSLCGRPDEHTKRILQIQIDGGESHGRDN